MQVIELDLSEFEFGLNEYMQDLLRWLTLTLPIPNFILPDHHLIEFQRLIEIFIGVFTLQFLSDWNVKFNQYRSGVTQILWFLMINLKLENEFLDESEIKEKGLIKWPPNWFLHSYGLY